MAYYLRVLLEDRWSCFCILEGESRSLAERVADLFADRYSDDRHPVQICTREHLDTPAKIQRAIEQSRVDWDRAVIASIIDQARAERRGSQPPWTQAAARAARRALVDLEAAVLADQRSVAKIAAGAGLEPDVVREIRAGRHLALILAEPKDTP